LKSEFRTFHLTLPLNDSLSALRWMIILRKVRFCIFVNFIYVLSVV